MGGSTLAEALAEVMVAALTMRGPPPPAAMEEFVIGTIPPRPPSGMLVVDPALASDPELLLGVLSRLLSPVLFAPGSEDSGPGGSGDGAPAIGMPTLPPEEEATEMEVMSSGLFLTAGDSMPMGGREETAADPSPEMERAFEGTMEGGRGYDGKDPSPVDPCRHPPLPNPLNLTDWQ